MPFSDENVRSSLKNTTADAHGAARGGISFPSSSICRASLEVPARHPDRGKRYFINPLLAALLAKLVANHATHHGTTHGA
jgi:hypothetical protein